MQVLDVEVQSNLKLNMAHRNIDVIDKQTLQSIKGQEKFEDTMCKELSIYLEHHKLSHDLHNCMFLFTFHHAMKVDSKLNQHCYFSVSSIIHSSIHLL
jgi:hypothetical protein